AAPPVSGIGAWMANGPVGSSNLYRFLATPADGPSCKNVKNAGRGTSLRAPADRGRVIGACQSSRSLLDRGGLPRDALTCPAQFHEDVNVAEPLACSSLADRDDTPDHRAVAVWRLHRVHQLTPTGLPRPHLLQVLGVPAVVPVTAGDGEARVEVLLHRLNRLSLLGLDQFSHDVDRVHRLPS